LSPPYNKLVLHCNYTNTPLLEINLNEITDKPVFLSLRKFVKLGEHGSDKPLLLYFVDEKGRRINKTGKTSLTLVLKED